MEQLPYNSFGRFLRKRFGFPVYRAVIDAGFSCPNRDGRVSRGGCLYCDETGSGPGRRDPVPGVSRQIRDALDFIKSRYGTDRCLAYFQAFTNTYDSVQRLEALYREALGVDGVVGLIIGTRPDCLTGEVLDLLEGLHRETFLLLEIGLQSASDETLERINRGHSFDDFAEAVSGARVRELDIGVHVVLGLPGESRDDMMNTARKISGFDIMSVKLHHLYILKGTGMEKLLLDGRYRLLGLEEYVGLTVDFLERTRPNILVARLAGSARGDRLVGPDWTARKGIVVRKIQEEFARRGTRQGIYWES